MTASDKPTSHLRLSLEGWILGLTIFVMTFTLTIIILKDLAQ